MDVVPYIARVQTVLYKLNKNNWSVYNRTALGHYPVATTETPTAYGFNLSATTDSTYGAYTTSAITVSGISSGVYSLTVNGMETLNNVNSATATYDLQPNGVNNSTLNDDVNLDVWLFNPRAAVPRSGIISSPVMKINPASGNGMIGFAFADGPLYFSMPGTVSATEYSYYFWQASFDFMTSISFAYDSKGHVYGTAAGGDINSSAADKFSFMTDRWGVSGRGSDGSYVGSNALRLDSIGQYNSGKGPGGSDISFDKYRIKSPSLVASRPTTTGTNLYLAYYDNLNDEIRFRSGTLPDSTTGKEGFGKFVEYPNVAINQEYPDSFDNTTNVTVVAGGSKSLTANIDGVPASIRGGEFVSLGVVSGTSDIVVMVWFDATNQALMYSYNATPLSGTGWSSPIAIFSGAGEYCQIAVDYNKGIHIAAYDINNADLVYAYLSGYDDTTPETCIVDSFGIVGTHISIDTALKGGKVIPYIGYYSSSSIRPKYAYKVDTTANAPAGATNDAYTGAWEVTLVPTPNSVCDDNINVGVWKDGSTGIIKSSTKITSTYQQKSGYYSNAASLSYGKCYGNGTPNGVLGYAIKSGSSGYIETAQMQ
jgi:hypothetical protein